HLAPVDLDLGIAERLPPALNDQPLAAVGEERKDDTAIQPNDRPLPADLGRAKIVALYGHRGSLARYFVVSIPHANDVISKVHHRVAQEIPEQVAYSPRIIRLVPGGLIDRLLSGIQKPPCWVDLLPERPPRAARYLYALNHWKLPE